MLESPLPEETLRQLNPEQLQSIFFSRYKTFSARVGAIETLLGGPSAPYLRERIGRWVIERLPAAELVPDRYSHWRPLVQDAMLFMFLHLSAERLAPKLVEQMELPQSTATGARVLKLIAKVPGLQKLGQVLARNRNCTGACVARLRNWRTEFQIWNPSRFAPSFCVNLARACAKAM